MNAKQF